MSLVFSHLKLHFLILLRQPSYVLSTLIFPSLFFLMFAHPNADSAPKANMLMASFAAFAVLGVAFLDFGVSVAKDRATNWVKYLRTLPVSPWQIFLARTFNALIFAIVASWIVIIIVKQTTPADLKAMDLLRMTGVLVVGGLPFAMMGFSVGYWTNATSALPITNLIYLTLSFAGGLWLPPNALPEKIQEVSEYLPTRFYGEMVWSSVLDREFDMKYLWGALIYTLVFLIIAIVGYRKDRA